MTNQPELRYGRGFGDMTIIGDKKDDQKATDFLSKPINEQIIMALAWSEGCPVPEEVIEKYGLDGALARYGDVMFADKLILAEVKKHNPALHDKLTLTITRKAHEPVGAHESKHVPHSHSTMVVPPNTPWGFSLKRLLIDQFGQRKNERSTIRIQKGLEILEKVAKQRIGSPLEFLAVFAEKIIKADGEKTKILRDTLCQGHLNQHNLRNHYKRLVVELKKHSPTFLKEYKKLSTQDRVKFGIAEVSLK